MANSFQFPQIDITEIEIQRSKYEIKYLTSGQENEHIEILQKETNLCKGLKHEADLADKINSIATQLQGVDEEITLIENRERKIINRVGYGAGTLGFALLCPLSWLVGVIYLCICALGQSSPPDSSGTFLFEEPVKKCDLFFKRAFYSAKAWNDVKNNEGKKRSDLEKELKEYHQREITPLALYLEQNKEKVQIKSMQATIEKLLQIVQQISTLP